MKNLILHLPHASTHFPHKSGFVLEDNLLNQEIIKLTDWYTDDLFSFENAIIVKAEFSRIFCDVERFENDEQEVMAQYGMGVLYEKTDNGKALRSVTPELRKEILSTYYRPHHEELNNAVNQQLQEHNKALIVDCHSFPMQPLVRDLDKNPERPDYNIGIDPYHTPTHLVDASVEYFEQKGLSLGVNWPYAGSIVPMMHYQKNKNVESIMLEINRSLYLKEGTTEKSDNYNKTKEVVHEFLEMIHTEFSK